MGGVHTIQLWAAYLEIKQESLAEFLEDNQDYPDASLNTIICPHTTYP